MENANQFIDDLKNCKTFIKAITKVLIDNHISPSYRPTESRPIRGSQYFTYRYVTFPPSHQNAGQWRESSEYKPEGIDDPFQEIRTRARQEKSRGLKALLPRLSALQDKNSGAASRATMS